MGTLEILVGLILLSLLVLYFVYCNYVKVIFVGNRVPVLRIMPIYSWAIFYAKSLLRNDLPRGILQVGLGFCKLSSLAGIHIFDVGLRRFAVFHKADTVKVLLNSPAALNKSWEYRFLHPWLGTGLLTSSDDKWKSRRKLLTPAFHFRILEDCIPIFEEQSNILVEKLHKLGPNDWTDIVPLITSCTLDIICEAAMGVRIHTQSGASSKYIKAVSEMTEVFIVRCLNPLFTSDFIFNYCLPIGWRYKKNLKFVHDFTRKVIKEKEVMMKKNMGSSSENDLEPKRKAFLELLLEHRFKNRNFTEEDIREEVDTFMFEGHDTTAMALSWTLYCLGLHPEVQEKVWAELEEIFQGNPNRSLTTDDLKNMKYMECVMKETLRLYPPVPLVAREISDDLPVLDGTISSSMTCAVNVAYLHRDPEQFPDPEKFDPDRFLSENCADRHPYAYLPFSGGPRNCIGQKFAVMDQKVVLAHILRKFKLISLDQRDKIIITYNLVGKNFTPLRLHFIPRNQIV